MDYKEFSVSSFSVFFFFLSVKAMKLFDPMQVYLEL